MSQLMKPSALIGWVDRLWDEYPKAKYWFGLILVAGWLPLLLIPQQPITNAIAVVWGAFWTILFVWRLFAQLRRLDTK